MNRNKNPIYIFSFFTVIVFIFTTFFFYNFGLYQVSQASQVLKFPQFPRAPQSKKEMELAKLFYEYMLRDKLDEFVKLLDTYPQYIHLVHHHSGLDDFLTPLQFAAVLGKDKFIDELLKRRVDPSLPTLSRGDTILHLSSIPHITARFIDLKLDLEALNKQNMTPLIAQFFKRELNKKVILTLLEAGANVEAEVGEAELTVLHLLFKPYRFNHQRDVLLILQDVLKHSGKVDARSRTGITPLHLAASNNEVRAIQILVDKAKQIGIEDFVNIKDFSGNTPLVSAYLSFSWEATGELLRLGVNPLLQNRYGESINEKAHRDSMNGSVFGKFVVDEINKYFKFPDRCAQPLTTEGKILLYESRYRSN